MASIPLRRTTAEKTVRRATVSLLLCIAAPLTAAFAAPAAADTPIQWAPAINLQDPVPTISAPDTRGNLQSLDTLAGEHGLLFLFTRTSDW